MISLEYYDNINETIWRNLIKYKVPFYSFLISWWILISYFISVLWEGSLVWVVLNYVLVPSQILLIDLFVETLYPFKHFKHILLNIGRNKLIDVSPICLVEVYSYTTVALHNLSLFSYQVIFKHSSCMI